MFTYVFGGAIDTGSDESYVDYMLPGILLITIASGVAYTAYRLFLDMQGGIFERFQSMPIARSSVLWAHVLTSLAANLVSVAIVIGVALIMGFRTGASVAAWLAVVGILILFTLALTWIAVIAGLSAKTVDGASAFSYPLIFLPFISSAFVPTDSMPGPVAWFAENQPVTSIVDTLRALFAAATRRQRHLDRARLARRHPRRRLRVRDRHLPPQDQLRPPSCQLPVARATASDSRAVAVCQNPGVPTLADLVRDDHRAALAGPAASRAPRGRGRDPADRGAVDPRARGGGPVRRSQSPARRRRSAAGGPGEDLLRLEVSALVAAMGRTDPLPALPEVTPDTVDPPGYFGVLVALLTVPFARAYHREHGVDEVTSWRTFVDIGRNIAVYRNRHGRAGFRRPGLGGPAPHRAALRPRPAPGEPRTARAGPSPG